MQKHKYWGKVEEDYPFFSGDIQFVSKYFPNKSFKIFLGEGEYENGREEDLPPTTSELDEFEKTYLSFLDNLEEVMEEVKEKTFEYYSKYYAHFYENEEKSGEKPLKIKDKEHHFQYMQDVVYLRVVSNHNIIISIHYELDTEHGIEIRLENNQVLHIGGIADT